MGMTIDIFYFIFVLLCYCRNSNGQSGGDLSGSDAQVPSGGDNRLSDGDAGGSAEDSRASEKEPEQLKGTTGAVDPIFRALESNSRGVGPFKKWRMGTVPYYIDGECYDDIITRRIHMAMKNIESASCVVFKNMNIIPHSSSFGSAWLHITNQKNEKECVHSTRFGNYGETVLTLGFECIHKRDITHALLHVLGFKDEVTHPHRDSFVRILWENIQPQYHHLFAIQNEPTPYQTLVEYDTMSIMHFHDRAFSSNGGATITPLISGLLINPSETLSQLDKMKLRLAFGHECNKRKVDNLFETCKGSLMENKNAGNEDGDGSGSASDKNASDNDKGGSASDENDKEQGSDGSGSDVPASGEKKNDGQKQTPGSDNDVIVLQGSDKEKSEDKLELKGSLFGKVPIINKRG